MTDKQAEKLMESYFLVDSLKHLNIHTGRSSQATLSGYNYETVESLYLSPALVERLNGEERGLEQEPQIQLEFARV